MNEYPFQRKGLPPSHTPMNKEWLPWKTELISYTPKVRRVTVDANPYSSSCSSSKFTLCSCLQPQLLHWSESGRVRIHGAEYGTIKVASPFLP